MVQLRRPFVLSFGAAIFASTAVLAAPFGNVESRHYPGNHYPGKSGHGSWPGPGWSGMGKAKAIYTMTNKSPNSIVAIPVAHDGTLSGGTTIATGGDGGNVFMDGEPAAPDALSSQDAIVVVGNYLFAVNAGSNSVSMFSISPWDPTSLTLLSTTETTGDFPTAVAVSLDTWLVCAAHTGAAAGISCASFCSTGISTPFDALRPFELNQSNPPTGPLNGIGDTFFTADSSKLITMVKGEPPVNNTGFISVIPMNDDGSNTLSTEDTHFSPPGTAVLFGSVQIPGTSTIFISDASFGYANVDLNDLSAAPTALTEIPDNQATCWAEVLYYPGPLSTTVGFVTDVLVNHLVAADTATGDTIQSFDSANGNTGMIDLVLGGGPYPKAYALAPNDPTMTDLGARVAVFDITDPAGGIADVMNFDLTPLGVDKNAQGMAIYRAW